MAKITKEVLSEALKKLLKKKSWEHIKVTELVSVAGVNRQTFYYNFEDIYDLLKWSVNKEIHLAFDEVLDYKNWQECLIVIFRYFQENEKMILNIVQSSARPYFERVLRESFEPVVEKIVQFSKNRQKNIKDIDEDSFKFIIETYTLIAVKLVFEWIDCGMKEEVEDFICPYIKLLEGSYSFFAEKY